MIQTLIFSLAFIPLQLVSVLNADDLSVSVEYTDCVTVTRTVEYQETTIGDFVFDGPLAEKASDPVANPAAVIKVATPYKAIRVKCYTAPVSKLNSNTWCLTDSGRHVVDVLAIGLVDGEIVLEEEQVTVELNPTPQPDDEDDDEPEPTEPQSIIGGDGFRVLIVYESSQTLPAAQQSILGSQAIRNYLNQHTAIDNNQRAWRIYDQDTKFRTDNIWKTAIERPRNSVPWILISSTNGSFEGPLPANVNETLELINQYKDKQ